MLVCDLGEQLREHAGHVCQGGDDRGGVGGIDEVAAARLSTVVELVDGVRGLGTLRRAGGPAPSSHQESWGRVTPL